MPASVRSFCRICTSQCGILVDAVGDQVQRVRGDRDQVPRAEAGARLRRRPAVHLRRREPGAGNIRAVLNLGGGLLTAFPGEDAMRRALAKLKVLATLEIIENETTALSTHVLPTKDQLERADINLWDFLSPRVAGMYSPAVVAPAGMRRSAWWVLAGLGRRLGYEMPPAPENDGPEDDDAMLAAQVTGARHLRRHHRQPVCRGWPRPARAMGG